MAKFKIPAKFLKHVSCGYLYKDGHMVICYHKYDKLTGAEVKWATVHSPLSTGVRVVDVQNSGMSRIVLHSLGSIKLAMQSVRVDFWNNNSTESSKEKGIQIKTVCFQFSNQTWDHVDLHEVPGLIGSDAVGVIQTQQTFEQTIDKAYFGDHVINKEHSTI